MRRGFLFIRSEQTNQFSLVTNNTLYKLLIVICNQGY